MIDSTYITVIFTSIGFIAFAFMYWKDATSEGFSSDRIFDSIIIIIFGGIIGGKLLFRPIYYDYFRYQIISAPLVLEGVLLGGAIAAYYVVKKNKWEFWKIGDMIAPGLTLFQAILFFGFWFRLEIAALLILAALFIGLFILISLAKYRMKRYSQLSAAQLSRLEGNNFFTGALMSIYLTGSSLIAMLFLVTHPNLDYRTWWIQVAFYLLILIATFFGVRKAMHKQDVSMGIMLPKSFIESVKRKLSKREKEIEDQKAKLEAKDPFIQEHEHDGSRNMDDLDEEATDVKEHENIAAQEKVLKQEKKEIEKVEKKIEDGTYGVCEECGNAIDDKRLKAYPTATLCITCADKKS